MPPLHGADDLFRERFADPATRSAALAELIPGTQSAYFYAALDHQLAGREEEFQTTIAAWKAASTRKENPISAESMTVSVNRHVLMDYQKNPVVSLAELIRPLNLKFTDTRPDAAAAAERLPTRLDPALISEAAFEQATIARFPKDTYAQYSGQRRFRELEQVEKFDAAEIRWFLDNLDRADLPGVVPLIDRALGLDRTLSFTKQPLLAKLTAKQLESLLELHPELRQRSRSTSPTSRNSGAETDFVLDPKAHAEHVSRCRDFILTLPPALNSLKAHVLFHHLRLQADLGNYPKDDFLAFLALPRARHELLKVPETADPAAIRLDQDFSAATACPPVSDDLPLI